MNVRAPGGREPRNRHEQAVVATAAEISPELVLVCPELGEQARAALSDRPWEMFVPRLPARPIPIGVAPSTQNARSWSGRLASAFPAVLIAGFVAVVVVGSLPWIGERPTLGPPPARLQPTPAVTTPTVPRETPATGAQQAARRALSGTVSRRQADNRR